MNLVQFKRHDADGDVFIDPAHVAVLEPSGAAGRRQRDRHRESPHQAGLALVRVQEPIKDVVDKLRREPAGLVNPSRRTKKTSNSPASAA